MQAEENLTAVTAAKDQSETSLQATIDAMQHALSELQARFETAQKSAEQKLMSLSGTLAETKAALDAETRITTSQKEDLDRVFEEKEKAEAHAETLAGSIRELQEALVQEKNRYRENEARMNGLIQQRDLELGELRTAHDDTRTALSSHASSLEQLKRELDAAAADRMELEGELQAAEEKVRQAGQDLVSTSEARELDKQKFSSLNDDLERVKTSLEQETLRRQETENQLRDALSQQQHMEQDLDRLMAETRTLHADLITEKRMHEEAKEQNQSLEEQVAALNQEKREAEQAAADLSAEIDQARTALADEWEDHMTDKERLAAAAAPKPQPRPAPFPGLRREAEIIKKRSLIVKTPNIPSEIRPLPKSMVAIDPVKTSEFDTPRIKSVEDLYEDDEDDRKKPAERPVVSIVQEPATEPVRDVLPDVMSDRSGDEESFFEDNRLSGTDSDDITDDDADDDDSSGEQNDSGPVSGQNIAFNRAQWLDLLKWSHHCDVLSQDQRMQIVRMGRLIQKGRRLTNKQEEQVLEMIALVRGSGTDRSDLFLSSESLSESNFILNPFIKDCVSFGQIAASKDSPVFRRFPEGEPRILTEREEFNPVISPERKKISLLSLPVAIEPVRNPQDKPDHEHRCGGKDDRNPLHGREGDGGKHGTAVLDDGDLDRDHEAHHDKEGRVAFEERRHLPVKRPAVDPVPDRCHDEAGKEDRAHLFRCCPAKEAGRHLEKAGDDEERAGHEDREPHERCDDRASCGTGVWFIRPLCGASEQRANAARVSMMILIQRIWMMVKGSGKAEQRRDEDEDAGAEVDGELEEDEPLDVLVQRPAPPDRARDRGKGVVQEDDVACLPGNLCPGNTHGKAHVRVLEGRRIVRPVTGHCHDRPVPLERFDQEELVHGFGPGHHVKVPRGCSLFIFGERTELRAGHDRAALHDARLFCNGPGSLRVIPGDHPYFNPCMLAGGNGLGDIVPEVVADADKSVPREPGLGLVPVQ